MKTKINATLRYFFEDKKTQGERKINNYQAIKAIGAIFITLCSTIALQCSQINNQTIIRLATLADIDQIHEISCTQYQTTFKSLWTNHYASMTPANHTIDSFINKCIENNQKNNNHFILKQMDPTNNERVLIAETTQANTKQITGFCRFEKQNPQSMYIHFILVKNTHCRQGIAKMLAEQAMKEFDGVTLCNFRALIHNDLINKLYSEHGCKKTGEVSLDPNTGKISDNPNAPITHVAYSYTIK